MGRHLEQEPSVSTAQIHFKRAVRSKISEGASTLKNRLE